jgi:hypothetical protein
MRAAEEEKSAKPKEGGGRRLSLKKKMGLGLGFFCIFFVVKNVPPLPLFELWTSIYR